jgi:hypothetical protein
VSAYWHYRPDFYESLRYVSEHFDVVVVANQPGETLGLRTFGRENTGLDWGAFSHFLDFAWDDKADVLFPARRYGCSGSVLG